MSVNTWLKLVITKRFWVLSRTHLWVWAQIFEQTLYLSQVRKQSSNMARAAAVERIQRLRRRHTIKRVFCGPQQPVRSVIRRRSKRKISILPRNYLFHCWIADKWIGHTDSSFPPLLSVLIVNRAKKPLFYTIIIVKLF